MIISCENCLKNFDVEDSLIPENGRMLQCSSCDHKWFFKTSGIETKILEVSNSINPDEFINDKQKEKINNETKEIKSKISYLNLKYIILRVLCYFIVSIFTITAFVIILDTFKSPLSGIFPNLELYLFNLIEILKDVKFFIKDLIF